MADLTLAARSYLLGRPEQRLSEKKAVLDKVPDSISFLLNESVHILKEFNPLPNLRNTPPEEIEGECPRNFWVQWIANPAISDVYEITRDLYGAADNALIWALDDPNGLVCVFSSLVMMEIPNPGRQLVDQLAKAAENMLATKGSRPYYRDSGILIVLYFVMYQGGHRGARKLIEDMCRKENQNYEDMKMVWRNTVLNYLFAETGR